MRKMMFLYESLSVYQKDMIDNEIREKIKSMIINKRSFDYDDCSFLIMVDEIILYGRVVNALLGNTVSSFNLKESIVKSRASKIAYEIEKNRPNKELVSTYIEHCKTLDLVPSIDVFFDKELASELVLDFSAHIKALSCNRSEGYKKEIEVSRELYSKINIDNKIKLFERLFEDFYSQSYVYLSNKNYTCTEKSTHAMV